jgi:hypothetical protein
LHFLFACIEQEQIKLATRIRVKCFIVFILIQRYK